MRILTVFAGRKPNLEILMGYAQQAPVDEIHLWNFARLDSDSAYLRQSLAQGFGRTSSASLEYLPIHKAQTTEEEVEVKVSAAHDAHIQLSRGGVCFEVILGGWGGHRSAIRWMGEERGSAHTPNILHQEVWGTFGIRWTKEGQVRVFRKGSSVDPLLDCVVCGFVPAGVIQPGERIRLAVSTGHGAVGRWRFEGVRVYVMEPCDPKVWRDYYDEYARAEYASSVIVKCDDDIVFMDVARMGAYLDAAEASQPNEILYANVINNNTIAYLQQNVFGTLPRELGMIDPRADGRLWQSAEMAEAVHRFFLIHHKRLCAEVPDKPTHSLREFYTSINFLAMHGTVFVRLLAWLKRPVTDDEREINMAVQFGQLLATLYRPFYVSHLSYFKQLQSGTFPIDALRLAYKHCIPSAAV